MTTDDLPSTVIELQREVAKLRQQNDEHRRLASFQQQNPVSTFEYDLQGQLIYHNPAAQQALTSLGEQDARIFLPDDLAVMGMSAAGNAPGPYVVEKRINDRLYEEVIIYSQEYNTVRIYATDITQRWQYEDALKTSEQELIKTHEFFEGATHGMGVLIAQVDTNYRYTYFNQAYQDEVRMLSGKDIQLGMSIVDIFAHQPALQRTVMEEWSQALSGASANEVLTLGDPAHYQKTYNMLHMPIWDEEQQIVGAREVAYNISDQVRMQEALMESEARFRMVLKNAPVTVAAQDKNLRFIWAYNQRTVNPADVIGKTDTDLFPPEVAAWTMSLKRQVLETGKELSAQGWVISGGKRLFLELFVEPICGKDGQITGVGIATVDLTSVKLAEQSWMESEARYRSLFEGMTEGFAVHEMIYDESGEPVDYHFREVNPAFERLTGLKRETVIGKTYRQVLPDEGDRWTSYFEKVMTTGEPIQFEVYSPSMEKHFEIFAYRCDPNQFATIVLDITARKQMEDNLRINLTKYHVLFDSLPLGVTITDRSGQILESNLEAVNLLGLSEEEQKRRLIDGKEWKIIRPDKTLMPAEEFASVRAMQEQRRIEDVEMGIIKDDDQITWISVTASPLPLEKYGIVITYNDITRRMLAEEALHRAHDKLEITIQHRTHELQSANIELKDEIEERKRIEKQLVIQTKAVEAERQRFNDVLEILPVYTILLTPDYHVAFANRYFRERFGEDQGRKCYEYLFGLREPCENCETFKVLQTKNRHRWEWTGPDQRHYDVFDFPFKDVDGTALILELGIDVTERQLAEEKLRQLNAYNRSLIESSLDALVTITPEGKIGDVNSVTEAITGYERAELIGKEFHSYFTHPNKARSGYQQVFDTGMVRDYELEIQHRDGHITPVTYNASIYRDESGRVAGVFAAAHDITEYKKAEEALRKSEQQYRSLVIATSQIVWQTNAKGEVVEDLPMWRDFTGQTLDECRGQGWLNAVHPADRERVAEVWARAVKTESLYGTEYRIRDRSSEYHDFAVRGVPINDKEGKIESWIGTCTDITEKKNYENQLIQAEKNAAIGRMVGSVTHEINNPLQTIKNCLYLIQQDIGADSRSKEPMDMAISETGRLSNIVGQLRQLYRPQGIQTMHTQGLLAIIHEVQSLISHHLSNSHVTWKTLTDGTDYSVNCVREQIIEVLLNMCMNAIEAMQPIGGELFVNIIHSTDKDQVGVVISDTGPGIKPEILPHIFEPFITTKEFGLGLGLSICYGIVQKHGGQITVESRSGQGTSFTVWLPVVK